MSTQTEPVVHVPAAEWLPKCTVQEADAMLTAPGTMHEMERALIDGRVYRVYKNLPPNVKSLWLRCANLWEDRTYIVFENDRITYGQMHERASRLACLLYSEYAVRKGDRVAICMRNLPEFVMAFWATHLIGAVATMINAWASPDVLLHCISSADPKVLIVDPERADRLTTNALVSRVAQKTPSLKQIFVARSQEGGRTWSGIRSLEEAMAAYNGAEEVWSEEADAEPDDDVSIFFTSGTSGVPKGVLSSQRGFLGNILNAVYNRNRALLRDGLEIPPPDFSPKSYLISVPLFHVTGLTSHLMMATFIGAKVCLLRRWDKDSAVQMIVREKVNVAGGVPSMIMDLLETQLGQDNPLESLSSGGAPAAEPMAREAMQRFPKASVTQGYGLSETNALSAGIQGHDYLHRPTSTGLPPPIVDLVIVDPVKNVVMPPNEAGELWIRGPNVMKGYWRDPEATAKVFTKDGYFKTGDLAMLDEDGFLYILDRIKDMIIRGGENIHCIEVENAIYADERLNDVAVVSVPDRRLGELVAAVVHPKPGFEGLVREEEIIAIAQKSLPAYAVPVFVHIRGQPLEKNAAGKIMKDIARKEVREEWAKRQVLNLKGRGADAVRAKL